MKKKTILAFCVYAEIVICMAISIRITGFVAFTMRKNSLNIAAAETLRFLEKKICKFTLDIIATNNYFHVVI